MTSGTVDIPTGELAACKSDWEAFLSDLEVAYADKMRSFLKHDLGAQANIVDTQVSYGGAEGLRASLAATSSTIIRIGTIRGPMARHRSTGSTGR